MKKHGLGTARQLIKLEERSGDYFKPHSLAPLTDKELVKHEEDKESYDQKQAAVREVVYRTVDKSTFLQIKNEATAVDIWKKVITIHTDKGMMYETNLLMQLQMI